VILEHKKCFQLNSFRNIRQTDLVMLHNSLTHAFGCYVAGGFNRLCKEYSVYRNSYTISASSLEDASKRRH